MCNPGGVRIHRLRTFNGSAWCQPELLVMVGLKVSAIRLWLVNSWVPLTRVYRRERGAHLPNPLYSEKWGSQRNPGEAGDIKIFKEGIAGNTPETLTFRRRR